MSDVLGPVLARQLQEKLYDKRKQAALEVERLVRDAVLANNFGRVSQIVTSIARDFASSPVSNARNGGLIALAAVAIALGSQALKPRLAQVVPPILACFADPDTRVRYYACESMYNVGKVARRDLLVFFNEIFDAVSRLVADLDISVKNGAELLDRLIKDIVCEHAAFVSQHQHQQLQIQSTATTSSSAGHARFPSEPAFPATPGSIPLIDPSDAAIFNFPRFIPLLAERIKALNPFTRMFLIQWITTLDAIPFLEMVSYLPEFLDGLFGYLCDVNADVRTAALNLLGEFLKEIHDILTVHGYTPGVSGALKHSVSRKRSNSASADSHSQSLSNQQQQQHIQLQPHQPETLAAPTTSPLHKSTSSPDFDEEPLVRRPVSSLSLASTFFAEGGKIVRPQHNQQNHATTATTTITTMTSTSNLQHHIHPTPPPTLDFPKLISILLPYLSAHDEETQATALRWIHEFVTHLQPRVIMVPFTPDFIAAILPCLSHRALITPIRNLAIEVNTGLYRLVSDCAVISPPGGTDSFDVRAAVDALTAQFQDENEEARVASLDWLLMLHKKSPKKVVVVANTTSEDSVLVQSLLKLLSDPSEEVVKKDLQLLAQISISSDDAYFTRFLVLLLDLFRRDRRVLESRGSLILRHLCLCLNPERMFRAFAEILEREEELEFASTMVQNLNIILVTAPELADVRRRLKNLETRDGLLLFAVLYRCWCHNPISTFTLCLLSQAYEHAYHLITTHFTDLEITIQFLIQVDKLVQLIESPVFTYLRLQLLEPERFPWLYKCLYGVLMLLPQSSAFATLRNRLGCVQSLVALYGVGGSPFSGGSGGNVGGSVPGANVGASPAPRTFVFL
ncbi:ARM repeat-containing protein [Rhizoclosmatium globosum]|uniref:ARM repeat-containing protein n=1 Tax=Rhizoclosmatium globosum TaxID=329046 RepID=A0A1Y2BVX7_9FUNG|nr:ARM repeat-containing protein [Rhizoclosmatium globosum]|eukprot:ORY38787.1 ARM repeat-containing protein [Rhizoclosmatium globosum]